MDQPAAFFPGSKPAQILDAAAHLFLQYGYGAVSMDAVAREAGVSKATLYAHFDGKDALFATLVKVECGKLETAVRQEELEQLSAAEALTLIARRFLTMLVSPRAVGGYRIVLAEAVRFPELAAAFYRGGPAVATALVSRYLSSATRTGLLNVPDPDLAAEQFLGMLKSQMHLRLLLGLESQAQSDEIETLITAAVGLFTRGYAP